MTADLQPMDGAEVTVAPGVQVITGLPAREQAQVDMQVSTAHKYPRSVTEFLREVEALACLDEHTAAECYYRLPRGGKRIEGPSVRLAEIVACCWRNLRWDSRTVEVGDAMITCQGYAWDLERNVAVTCEVRRRITDRNGRRYSEDMIAVTANAAQSIAMRNAIFRVVPFAFVRKIYERAKSVSLGEGKSHAQRIDAALSAWAELGQDEQTVLAALGRKGREDLSVDDLIDLRGMWTAVREGTITADAAMRPREDDRDGAKIAPAEGLT